MSKKDFRVNIKADGNEVRISLSDEQRSRIPRAGDAMFVVSPYPADDEDEDDHEKIKENAIVGYSYTEKVVRATALNDDATEVTVNGDFHFKLDENMTIKNGKNMVFMKEEDALDKYRSLMNASIDEAERRETKNRNIKTFLKTALEEIHH